MSACLWAYLTAHVLAAKCHQSALHLRTTATLASSHHTLRRGQDRSKHAPTVHVHKGTTITTTLIDCKPLLQQPHFLAEPGCSRHELAPTRALLVHAGG